MKTSGSLKSRWVVAGMGTVAVLVIVALFQAERFAVANVWRDALSPVMNMVRRSVHGVTYPLRLMKHLVAMNEESDQLKGEVIRLRHENLELHETLRAYQRVEKISGFHPPVGYRALPASIVAYEPTNFSKGCVINRGAKDNLFPMMVAVTDEGVVGRILFVSDRTARMMFLSDPNCRVSVVSERARVMGVVAGTGGSRCDLLYVSSDEDVQEGDRFLTSGQGGVFPKGLPVGRVTKVDRAANGISLSITLEPFVKFGRLEEILLIFPLSAP